MAKKPTPQDIHEIVYRGEGFYLPLHTLVEGRDRSGKNFKENIILSHINCGGSSFWIRHSVHLGEELKMIIDLPKRLSEDRELKLIIKGKVAFVESPKKENADHRVFIAFGTKYIITSDEQCNEKAPFMRKKDKTKRHLNTD